MKRGSPPALLAALFLAAACSGGSGGVTSPGQPSGPEPPTPPASPSVATSLRIAGSRIVPLSPGEAHALAAQILDQHGQVMPNEGGFTYRTTAPSRADVQADGAVRAGDELGLAWIHAQRGALRDSVGVWVQRPETEPSEFTITLVYSESVPDWWKPYLETAATRWEQVIRARLPAVDVASRATACDDWNEPPPAEFLAGAEDGVRLFVNVSDRFPEGTFVEAIGGPCSQRGLPHPTTVTGVITLNADFFAQPPRDERLSYLAHHEMGHTLGLVGVVQGFSPPWLDQANDRYLGFLGRYGYALDFGTMPASLSFARGAHWDFSDIMGRGPWARVSNATVGALMDLGYPAAWYGAGRL